MIVEREYQPDTAAIDELADLLSRLLQDSLPAAPASSESRSSRLKRSASSSIAAVSGWYSLSTIMICPAGRWRVRNPARRQPGHRVAFLVSLSEECVVAVGVYLQDS